MYWPLTPKMVASFESDRHTLSITFLNTWIVVEVHRSTHFEAKERMSYISSHGCSVETQLSWKHQKDIHTTNLCFKLEYARETFTQIKRSETKAQPASEQPHTVSPVCLPHRLWHLELVHLGLVSTLSTTHYLYFYIWFNKKVQSGTIVSLWHAELVFLDLGGAARHTTVHTEVGWTLS